MKEAELVREQAHVGTKSGTLIGKAHAELRNNIIAGRHRPGEKLRVEHLKRHYGVSSGTLREALTMLVADRLVIAEGQRGFRVMPVSPEDLIDLGRIRILLEKTAIREAIAHGNEEWEGNVVSSFHILNRAAKALAENVKDDALFGDWHRRHRAFHLALISAAPSKWTRYFLDLSYQQHDRYLHMFREVGKDAYKVRNIDAEHAEIVDAVLARDADAAERSLERHLTQTLDEWVRYYEKIGALESGRGARGSKQAGKHSKRAS